LNSSEKNQSARKKLTREEMDRIVAKARRSNEDNMKSYRERSLSIHPWVCARCGREFTQKNLHLLTVHHKDHNHDNNPADGSNWENLCVYCHDNEHRRYLDHLDGEMPQADDEKSESISHKPFAALADLLKNK
jgi:5-methylcytosine-specific restriction endonuclease McrA